MPTARVTSVTCLETGGLADVLALERQCRLHGLPSPSEPLLFAGLK
ncbi:MAG: hypothetical protein U5K38_03040 [Woeseiaceae bacterium]|nr:hypothetical protein [Woeseiaceae bacterium]